MLEEAYLPAHWRLFKHSGAIVSFGECSETPSQTKCPGANDVFVLGIALVVGGQILRSYAMKTASSNFSHV